MTAKVESNLIEPEIILSDVLPRYKETNPRNYDTLTLVRKRTELKAMIAHYKDISPAWLEMCWDFHQNTSEERMKEIIDTKEFEKPCITKRNMRGGVLKNSINITTRTPEELSMRENMINDFEIEENKKKELEKELEK